MHCRVERDLSSKLLKKSFTTSSIMSAQESTWDKKSGRVTSDSISAEELELRDLENSWVNMDLGVVKKDAEVKHAELKAGDIAAFDFEEGASCKSMTPSDVASDAETSYVDSDEEDSSEEDASDEDSESGSSEGDESSEDDNAQGVQFADIKKRIVESDDDENAEGDGEESNEEQEDAQEAHPLEWLIRGSFEDDLGLQEVLLALAHAGKIPQQAWDTHQSLEEWAEYHDELLSRIQQLEKSDIPEDKFDAKAVPLHEKVEGAGHEIAGLQADFKAIMEEFYINWQMYEGQEWDADAAAATEAAAAETKGDEPLAEQKEQMDTSDENLEKPATEETDMEEEEVRATTQTAENATEQYYDTEENLEGQVDLETGVESAQTHNPGDSMDTTESGPTDGASGNYSQDQSERTAG